jgi:branched-chain amino acid transport system permease protein
VELFIVSLIGGASLGGTFALIGLGLVLAFRATRTFNFAHGELMVLPAFIVAFFQMHKTLSFEASAVIGLVVAAAVAVALYQIVLQRTNGLPVFMGLIATLGVAAILDGLLTLIFGPISYSITVPWLGNDVVTLAGARLSATSLKLTALTLVLAGLVIVVFRYTRLGTQIRAAGQDAILASQGGINVHRVYMGSWAMAGLLAGIAGISYGVSSVINLNVTELGLAAIPVIMLGGMDSVEGAVVAGLLVGILQGFTYTYLGGEYRDLLTYSLLLFVLLFRAEGMFGTREVTRV